MTYENTTTDRADGPGFWKRLLVKHALRGADDALEVETPDPAAPPAREAGASPGPGTAPASPTPPPREADEAPPAPPPPAAPPAREAGASPGPGTAPASPTPPPREADEAPPSTPAPPLGGTYPTRAIVVIAAVPSLASLVWTAWSVADMLPAPTPVALAVGVVLDIALVAAVAIAWIAPAVSRIARSASWGIAVFAAVAVGVHGLASDTPVMGLFAAVPLISKLLWHLALAARLQQVRQEEQRARGEAAAEEEARRREDEEAARAAELDESLSHEQRHHIARIRQQAAYERELAAAETELDAANAEAAHQRALAELKRQADAQRARDRLEADVIRDRMELMRELQAAQPVSMALTSSGEVPDDLSALPVAGFGGVLETAPRGARRAQPRAQVVDPKLMRRAREVFRPGMSVRALREALGVGMPRAQELHRVLRSEAG